MYFDSKVVILEYIIVIMMMCSEVFFVLQQYIAYYNNLNQWATEIKMGFCGVVFLYY